MTGVHPVRVLIVDDEPLARRRIADLLAREARAEVVGMATSGAEAIGAIRAAVPDVVFLDVQMPDGTGLDVLRAIGPDAMPVTVFVTAYDQYALRAFDAEAVDYLVKPFDDERFEQAFRRARRAVEVGAVSRLSGQLIAALQVIEGTRPTSVAGDAASAYGAVSPPSSESTSPPDGYLERFAVESHGQLRVIPVSKVLYITASGPYAEIHTAERTHLLREQMQVLEERLDPDQFFRVHRSAIVRFDLIEGLTRNASGDYTVHLKGGMTLKVSRSRSDQLERRMGLSK